MFNKKRLFVAGAFLIALLFMTMYAGGSGEQGTTAMRIVKFIDGYNNAEISTQNVEVGKEAIVPDSPTHRNNLFIGWYNDETEITSFKNITENLTVISRYVDDINNNGIADSEEESYTVTFFDTIANENISVVDILTGMDATAPAVPSHDGYTFTGWSRGFTNVASNLTVNALYRTTEELESDDLITHTVRFLVGDEEISTQTIEEGASATAPDAPKIDEKVFTGWDTSFDKVTTDLTVKAVYADDINKNSLNDKTETRYTVTFVAGTGGTLDGNTEFTNLLINLSLEDNGVTIPEPIEEDGYEFNGWNVELTSETKVAGNTTYTANFKDIEKPRVEIKNVNEYNPKSFDIWAVDLESGLRRMDYSLYNNDNTKYLGGGTHLIEDIVYEIEINNITEYSLEDVKYLLKDLPDGEYTLRATVSDNEGNIDHAVNYDFDVDTTSPIAKITLVDGDNNQYNEDGIKFGENVTVIGEVDTSEKHIKSHSFEITNPDASISHVEDMNTSVLNYEFNLDTSKGSGEYKIRYVATDKAGNRNDDPENTNSTIRTLIVDVDGPTISLVEALNYNYKLDNGYDHYDNKPIEIKVTATDNYSENLLYKYGDETTWVESNTYTCHLTAEYFLVKVKDEFGNVSTSTIGLHIDENDMTINYETTGGVSYNGDYIKAIKPLYIKPRNADKLLESGYLWSDKADGITQEELKNSFWHNNQIIVPTADGTYYLWSYAIDYNGNKLIQKSNAFIIDNVKPKDVITHYSTTDPTNKAVIVTITFNEAVTIVNSGWEKINDNNKTVWQKSFDSNNTEVIMFKDLAGNENETNISIANINKVPPKITFSGDNPLILGRIDFTFKPKDGASATDYEDEDITSQIIIIKNNLNIWEVGTYEIVYQVTDKFGNTTTRTRFVEVKRWKDL